MKLSGARSTEAIRSGGLRPVMKNFVEQTSPEGIWFTMEHGHRTMLAIFDLNQPGDMPRICEPLFQTFDAEIDVTPALTAEDVATALAS
jgi:hypothetical protein